MIYCKICKKKAAQFYCRKNNYQYYFCFCCQTLFLNPSLSKRELDFYYRKNFSYETGQKEEKRIKIRAKIILKNLFKLNPSAKTLLDIGSGFGYLLDEAKKTGLKAIGIEPAKKLTVNKLDKIKIYKETFEEYLKKNKSKKFDFITAIHVIEHLYDPKKFIRQASKLLNHKGILYIETPNLNSHLFYAEKENYTFLTPPEHLWIFSQKSFQHLLSDKIQSVGFSTYSHPEHLMGIIKRKIQITNNKIQINKKRQITDDKTKEIKINKKLKYWLFDKLLAPVFTPFLNLGGYGSILELYIRKKSRNCRL